MAFVILLSLFFLFLIFAVLYLLNCKYNREIRNLQKVDMVAPQLRGESSERQTAFELLNMGINPRAIFLDCYIRKSDGTYTQVDLVVATSQGLIVFEIKDYSGWIFGHFRQKYWTQILAYGKEKHRFYNPLMQNRGHIDALRENLPGNPGIPIYSVIVFFGSSILKDVTFESATDFLIYPSQIQDTILNITSRPAANFGDKYEIMNVLKQAVENGNIPEIVNSQHIVAAKANRNKPQSSYRYSFRPHTIFKIFR